MKDKCLQQFSDMEGKTIAKAFDGGFAGDDALLLMSDGTVAVIHYKRGYDGDGEFELKQRELEGSELLALGLIDQAEHEQLQAEAERQRQAQYEAEQRRQYERLKSKYEGK